MARKPDFYAYSVPIDERSNRPWRLIGAAWNNNGYISVNLDAIPSPGNKLVLGPPKESDEPGKDPDAQQPERQERRSRR